MEWVKRACPTNATGRTLVCPVCATYRRMRCRDSRIPWTSQGIAINQSRGVRREPAVLIVDDHVPMREAIRACIEHAFPGLPVIEAPDGATALKCAEAHRPCLVLMDINLPDANGLDLTRDILKQWPCTFVAGISIDTGVDLPERVLAAGAVPRAPSAGLTS